nr:hypothetical protein [Terriglobales bacterium]
MVGCALFGLVALGCIGQVSAPPPAPGQPASSASVPAPAISPQKVSLDSNESLFAVLSALNACGYDQDLAGSDPLRAQIRSEIQKNAAANEQAAQVTSDLCAAYKERLDPEPARMLASYVSLALYLGPPPDFTLKVKDADLAPDASQIQGMLPLIEKFYVADGLHGIWEQHAAQYAALGDRWHEPLAKMLFDTEVYLKLPSAGYLGRRFTVYLEPMGAPGQTNARNYGSDYYVVISPGTGGSLKMDQIRHSYLHFLLDPLAQKYPTQLKRLTPLLTSVKSAPMDTSYKDDISLLVTECFIRASEARLLGGKVPEEQKQKVVDEAVAQGYILTPYFYQELVRFEKDPAGIRNVFGQMLLDIDVNKEQKRADQVQFAHHASPEVLRNAQQKEAADTLNQAEKALVDGHPEEAQRLAQQALDGKQGDPGRAYFILARAATVKRDMQGSKTFFQKALESTQDATVIAWSHLYLGRISDLQEDRPAAVEQYRAALA